MDENNIKIRPLQSFDVLTVQQLIRDNLAAYKDVGSVLAASFRRLENLEEIYNTPGSQFLVAEDVNQQKIVGGVGIGPLHGLPHEEGIGEIRELVIEPAYRGQGIGARLLQESLRICEKLGYQKIYLETTPQMVSAQRLFESHGFRPVTHAPGVAKLDKQASKDQDIPCYYLCELAS